MDAAVSEWRGWGRRLRQHLRNKRSSLGVLAERTGWAESTLRSWTNGTRSINLEDFFALCAAADADSCMILYGKPLLSEEHRRKISDAVRDLLGSDGIHPPAKSKKQHA